MDDDSGGYGKIGGAGEFGDIGAGGGGGKGKPPNELRLEAEAARKARHDLPQGLVLPQTLRTFPDGSKLIWDWSHSHPTLLPRIIRQIRDICWALVLGTILQFVYNKDRPNPNQHKLLDIDGFVKKVKLGDDAYVANKKLDRNNLAVGSLEYAMDHIYSVGMEKLKETNRQKPAHQTFTIKGKFIYKKKATSEDIIELLLAKGPIGLTLDATFGLSSLKDGIYKVPKPEANIARHVVTIVAYGRTKNDEVFFDVRNTWGTGWGVNGHGRIMITDTSDDIFYLDQVIQKNKKKK